ncbi:DoxX family protein [Pseudomonas chlororaphis subsp. piscium]
MIGIEDFALLAARCLLATLFVVSAFDKLRLDPDEMKQIESLHLPFPAVVEWLTGLFEILGAISLVFGIYARVTAVVLALFVAFVSLMFVRFWTVPGPKNVRVMVRNIFVGNVTVVGGLLYVAVLGAGQLALVDI